MGLPLTPNADADPITFAATLAASHRVATSAASVSKSCR